MTNHKHLMILFLWFYFISLSVFAADTTPNTFTFIDQTDVALNTAIISNTITVSGIDTKTTISITGGSFSVNGAAYRTSKTTVLNGATVSIKQTSSKLNSTKKNAVLSIGYVKDTFSVTTVARDTTPNAFSFIDQINLPLNTPITSNSISIIDINAATAIAISGGSYSIKGGAFVTKAGTVTNGNTVTVKITSATTNGTTKNATLTVGGIDRATIFRTHF